MIHHISGHLAEVNADSVVVERDGVGYEIQTPKYAIGELAARRGQEITLHTLLFVDTGQNTAFAEPQLIGFPRAQDKLFFKKFISVKGIGFKKALRSLTEPVQHVAGWIEDGDVASMKRLPGIGARAAELIVAELRGKLIDMTGDMRDRSVVDSSRFNKSQRDAVEIMVSLGDSRVDAEQWLERARELFHDADTPEDWLRCAYRIKTGAEEAQVSRS